MSGGCLQIINNECNDCDRRPGIRGVRGGPDHFNVPGARLYIKHSTLAVAYIDTGTRTHAHFSRHEKKSSFNVSALLNAINNKRDVFTHLVERYLNPGIISFVLRY